jgi:hypothetical protein
VVGLGTGYKISAGRRTEELCVVVLVRQKLPKTALPPGALIPKDLEGVPTDVVQVGELRALQSPMDRWRPAPGGVSMGHYQITTGTFGCVVRDQSTGNRLILSNNHVLANANDAAPGDPILQPGPIDGGQVDDDTIARLERFCPIEFDQAPGSCSLAQGFAMAGNSIAQLLGSQHRLEVFQSDVDAVNLVDAAVARPLEDNLILDEILEIGELTGTTLPILGMPVRKFGRTTNLTTGTINVLEATVTVRYGSGRSARFEDQIVTSAMSQGGDSGSCLVDGDSSLAVGLLFAGSDQATIHNPMQAVLDCLGVIL